MDGPRVPGDGDALRPVVGEQLEEHVREAEQRVRREALARRQLLREREEGPVGEVVAVDEEELGLARGRVVELQLGPGERLRRHLNSIFNTCRHGSCPRARPRFPCSDRLAARRRERAGRRGRARAPPPGRRPIADVGAAVRDALRFPLAGEPLETLVPRGGRATILVEPPALPIPARARPTAGGARRRRRRARASGVPSDRQTILVAAGSGAALAGAGDSRAS